MLLFVRHAQRGDNQFPKLLSEIHYDPPITSDSKITIQNTAQQMIKVFNQHKIKKIKIVSSKFLRCLMTSEQLSEIFEKEGFEINKTRQIKVEISEYLKIDWFEKYPLNNLIYDSQFRSKYIKNDWTQSQVKQKLQHPQNYVIFHNRIGKFRKQLKFPEQGECIMIVTHGFVVRQLCWRMNQIPNYSDEIKYCGFAAFCRQEGYQRLIRSRL